MSYLEKCVSCRISVFYAMGNKKCRAQCSAFSVFVVRCLEVELEANLSICKKIKIESVALNLCSNLLVEYLLRI